MSTIIFGQNIMGQLPQWSSMIAGELLVNGNLNEDIVDQLTQEFRTQMNRIYTEYRAMKVQEIIPLIYQHQFEPLFPVFTYNESMMTVRAPSGEYWGLTMTMDRNRNLSNKISYIYRLQKIIGSAVIFDPENEVNWTLHNHAPKATTMSIVESKTSTIPYLKVWHTFWSNPWTYLMLEAM